MIDWNDNAKAALQAFEDYLRENGVDGFDNGYFLQSFYSEFDPKYGKTTQTKTVADAVEREGEKWTHVVETTGKKCQLLTKEPDVDGYYAVILSSGNYDIEHSDFIKPIKPTISKAEAWDLCQDYEGSQGMVKYMLDLHDQYDII